MSSIQTNQSAKEENGVYIYIFIADKILPDKQTKNRPNI
jgi:hypothetical protein